MITFKLFTTHPRLGGIVVADWTYRHRNLVITTTQHGFGTAETLIEMPVRIAKFWFQKMTAYHVDVSEQGRTIWEGRVATADTVNAEEGLRIVAMGYWVAFNDIRPYQLWSMADTSQWETVTTDMQSARNDDLFEIDTEERLFIGLQKGTVYRSGGANDVGSLTYLVPSGSSRTIAALTATYGVLLPTNWVATIVHASEDFATATVLQTITGNGALQTGSINLTSLTRARVIISVYNNTGANVTYAGENGSNYAKFTDVRVKTTTSATLYADEPIKAMLAQLSALNSTQINPATTQINSPTFDIRNWMIDGYGDAEIDRLAALGDTAGYLWSCRVWENQVVWFKRRADMGRQWFAFGQVDVGRDFSTLRNKVYPRFENAEGNTMVGAAVTNTPSVLKMGLTREDMYDAPTTVSADATALTTTYLNDAATTNSYGEVVIEQVYDIRRSPARLTDVRAGDTITIIDNSVSASTDVDRLTTFRIEETSYDTTTRLLTVMPEAPLPRIESAIARRDANLVK